MHRITSKWPHQDCVKVEWNLGKRCNLDCSYCPAEIHDNFSSHTNIKVLIDAVDALAELGKPIRLSFTGGEPCVHPNIEELLEHASQRVDWINVTTNASRKAEWYDRQPNNHYVFSLHFEHPQWEDHVKNILFFSQLNDMSGNNKDFIVNVMAHHDHMEKVKSACTLFDGHYVKYAIRRIRWTEKHDWFDDMKYNEKDLQWILDNDATVEPNCVIDDNDLMHANDIIKKHLNQFEGWECNAGIESLMINWDGEVHRATCRVGGSLGNIYEGTFEQPEQSIVCTRKFCTCAADIPLTKISL